jgi:hypothetical protein
MGFDAHHLPFHNGTFGNIILFDLLPLILGKDIALYELLFSLPSIRGFGKNVNLIGLNFKQKRRGLPLLFC